MADIVYGIDGKEKIDNLRNIFAKAANLNGDYLTADEQVHYLSSKGVEKFKLKTLGFFGRNKIKTLDDLAVIFVALGIEQSVTDAKKVIPDIVAANMSEPYALKRPNNHYISLEEVKNSKGQVKYRIRTYR